MKVSIVIATHNKARILEQVLTSIFIQKPDLDLDVVIVDDNSSTRETEKLCTRYMGVTYIPIENNTGLPYRNPAVARNVGYRWAKDADVIICQSDDVIHVGTDVIASLAFVPQGMFNIATVWNYCPKNHVTLSQYTGNQNRRPFFFLGSLRKSDLYAVGGNSEDFVYPGFDDNWFADCLIRGKRLIPVYHESIVGYHIDHPRPLNLGELVKPSRDLYSQKTRAAERGLFKWEALGGPWDD